MKFLIVTLLIAMLTACNGNDFLPSGAQYDAVPHDVFSSTGIWAGTEYDNNDFICVFGYIFSRDENGDATGNRLIDGTGAEITCDPTVTVRVIITRTG